jgi:hypothetical protein
LIVSCLACQKKDLQQTPASKALLTLHVSGSYDTSTSDNWFIVYDANGQPLAYKAFESNQTLEINMPTNTSTSYQSLTVTILSVVGAKYELNTVFETKTGSQLYLNSSKPAPVAPGLKLGTVKVALKANRYIKNFALSNKFGEIGNPFTTEQGNNLQTSITANLYDNARHLLLFASDGQGGLKHRFFRNANANDSHSINYDQMQDFDNNASFSFPTCNDVSLLTMGRENDIAINQPAYLLQQHQKGSSISSISTGYLNTLAKYTTQLTAIYPTYSYTYYSRGFIPTASESFPPAADYELISKNIADFSSKVKGSIKARKSEFVWEKTQNIEKASWHIYSSQTSHKLPPLPDALSQKYPELVAGLFVHSQTTFYTEAPEHSQLLFAQNPHADIILKGISIR